MPTGPEKQRNVSKALGCRRNGGGEAEMGTVMEWLREHLRDMQPQIEVGVQAGVV